ncbi:MFS transporter [Abyssisolibacter fermentans]|uniref:MFS transporter n=1 Tax=Abyssisolibacter fermentans TaxID=1766203 RepID=UPI0008350DF1|nr:MFS transporter [Abyssisolibacter fermentans]
MNKSNLKKWFTLFVLILGGGTIYKLASIKDAFYIPMQEQFGLSHTQIGVAMGLYGTIGTFGYFISMYLSDRFSKKILLPVGLIGVGCVGLYLSTFPNYNGLLVTFALLAVFDTVIYWPVLLKAVRLLGNKDEQGRMFGFLEAGRGVIDTIVAFSALGLFALLGKGAAGLRGAIYLYSIAPIVIGIISYFLLEDDKIPGIEEGNKKVNKDKIVLSGVIKALKMPEIWIVSMNIFSVYAVYIGLTYFIPFLKDIYGLPVTLVGAYGIINQYGLKMIGGPVGGFLADKKFKSASKFLRVAFAVAAIAMTVILFLPHKSMNIYSGMTVTLGFGAIIFAMRAVFFAPVEEVQVPREISGAAMSIASFIGYAPYMFMYTVYGSILDKNPGMSGYNKVFMTMIGFSVLGIIISSLLVRTVNKNNNKSSAMINKKNKSIN